MVELAHRVPERSPPLKTTSTASPLAIFRTLSVSALTSSREYMGRDYIRLRPSLRWRTSARQVRVRPSLRWRASARQVRLRARNRLTAWGLLGERREVSWLRINWNG